MNLNSTFFKILLFIIALLPTLVLAEGFRLTGIPFVPDAGEADINEVMKGLYRLAIGIAAILAVVRLIFAGAKYMLTDVVKTKQAAKTDVQASIVGLLIVLGAVLILNTINPELTELRALDLASTTVVLNNNIRYDPCANDSDSAECCNIRDGVFISTTDGNICEFGSVDIAIVETGDIENDRVINTINCEESGRGRVFDTETNTCRSPIAEYYDFPPSSTLIDIEKKYCEGELINGEYNTESNTCSGEEMDLSKIELLEEDIRQLDIECELAYETMGDNAAFDLFTKKCITSPFGS